MLELGVAIRMLGALTCLAGALQAIAGGLEQLAHQLRTDLMSLGLQLHRETPDALAGPAQGQLRITSGGRFDQGFQVTEPRRGLHGSALAAGARTPQPRWFGSHCSPGGGPHLTDARADGCAGQTRGAGHGADATATKRQGFRRRPTPPSWFIQDRTECCKLFGQGSILCHDLIRILKRHLGYFISRRRLS
jgi:hypothetical protein